MKESFPLILLLVFLGSCHSNGQNVPAGSQGEGFTVFSWNLENCFDTVNDSLTLDDEFTPEGLRNWDRYRYYLKIRSAWKTILSAGGDRPPGIIALAEIENEKVLRDLFVRSPFGTFGYRIVHRDSPDPRGIDVALLYDPAFFELVDTAFIQPFLPGSHPTRDILYAVLRHDQDTLHLFVNHWPSKYGGTGYTEPFRKETAETLRHLTDSIFQNVADPYIICTGDFNDTPESVSISLLTEYHSEQDDAPGRSLVRLIPHDASVNGTIRFQGQWQVIDHFFLSTAFFNDQCSLCADSLSEVIYAPGFLLEPDEKYGGVKPFRTFDGMHYNGGVSDHLPVMLWVRFAR